MSMGREIRRVPPDWQHPRRRDIYSGSNSNEYVPTYDKEYHAAAREWMEEYAQWVAGTHPDQLKYPQHKNKYFWEWGGSPPRDQDYRHCSWTAEEATCYQIYENVSEGTPVSPVFETTDEMRDWLMRHEGLSAEVADRYMKVAYVPSMTYDPKNGLREGYDTLKGEDDE